MLYIISTPIGNLKDITLRALEAIQECDYLLCEDTRKSKFLLEHFSLTKPLVSFHKHNEVSREAQIIRDLKDGKTIGLLSDAGTPLICDPGHSLIQTMIESKLPFTTIPGASAIMAALPLSGLAWDKFQFFGFPKEKTTMRKEQWKDSIFYTGISGFYVAPHDLEKYVKEIIEIDPLVTIVLLRELTKLYEERIEARAIDLLEKIQMQKLKGEIVFLIQGKEKNLATQGLKVMELLVKEGKLKPGDAAKLAAKITKEKRTDLYNAWLDR